MFHWSLATASWQVSATSIAASLQNCCNTSCGFVSGDGSNGLIFQYFNKLGKSPDVLHLSETVGQFVVQKVTFVHQASANLLYCLVSPQIPEHKKSSESLGQHFILVVENFTNF